MCNRVLLSVTILGRDQRKGERVSLCIVPLSMVILFVQTLEGELYLSGGMFIEISDKKKYMASVGKPRSYMIQSIRSWSVVLKAKVKSTIRA